MKKVMTVMVILTVTAILFDIDVQVTENDVEHCQGLGSQVKINQRKQPSALSTGRTVEKISKIKKKVFNDFSKYRFSGNTKIFSNKNLTFKNQTLAFHGTKLKCEGHIFSSYVRNRSALIKKSERSMPIKTTTLKTFYDQFPGVFSKNEEVNAEKSTHQDI